MAIQSKGGNVYHITVFYSYYNMYDSVCDFFLFIAYLSIFKYHPTTFLGPL